MAGKTDPAPWSIDYTGVQLTWIPWCVLDLCAVGTAGRPAAGPAATSPPS
ncbi:hypothetical protein LN650_23570 [Klebsiella pneumoniae subsp. pneumoniae]|nr:hypothetical protein [Klebsiella pneumoniae subsp. pneumoniae]